MPTAEEAPSGAKRRGFKWLKRGLVALALLPVLAFGVSNWWLGGPWGCRFLEAKIQVRCGGLPTHIGTASWSPWNGVTLTEVEVSQPEPLQARVGQPVLRIDSVHIEPIWQALLERRLSVRAITLERPRLVLAVEMLAQHAQQAAPPPAGDVALTPPDQAPAVALNPEPDTPPPAAQATPPPAAPPLPAPPSRPTGWLKLRFASFQLVSAGVPQPILRLDDLSGDIPLDGDAAKSMVRLGSLEAGGQRLITDLDVPLAWRFPVLEMAPVSTSVNGLALRLAGKFALARGLPLHLAMQLPEQAFSASLPVNNIAAVSVGKGVVNAQFHGLLLVPGSWQGDLIADGEAVSVKHREASESFGIGHCGIILRGGILSCVDARLLGDELSLLGNGTLLADGRLAGVVRLVAAPDRASGLVRGLFPALATAPALTPLNTDQRSAFDLSLFGTVQEPQLQLGENGPILSLREALNPMHEARKEEPAKP
ncbi:MAG: AsmA family [Verrucomicrobiota bacterium]|jgi:hypothetical protein